jgi:hypothetical protein
MADFSTERLDPASRVPAVQGQQTPRDSSPKNRRRAPPAKDVKDGKDQAADPEPDAPPHQIDH